MKVGIEGKIEVGSWKLILFKNASYFKIGWRPSEVQLVHRGKCRMAEGEGFEPSRELSSPYSFSKAASSAT